MARRMMLYMHQQEMLDENPLVHGLWWECGLGKTLTAIKLIEQNVDSCLVVCPKSLRENWSREITKWSDRNIAWSIVTKEEFRRDWEGLVTLKFEGVIIDESHFFHGHSSKMHKNMIKYLSKVQPKCVYALTATPMMASPYSVMALQRLMGQKVNWRKFTQEFFYQMKMGRRMIWQPRKDKDHELQELIRSVGTLRSAKECLDLPDQIFLREDFDLTLEQKRAIARLEQDPTITTPIVRWTKVHQICGGTLKNEGKNDALYRAEKVSRVLEYLESEKKIIIVCRYNAELHMLGDTISTKVDWVSLINGQTKNRQEIIDLFHEQDSGVLLINAACSEGYNLKGVNTMIFYSLSFSLKDRVQMMGRIHGSGRGIQGQPSKYIDLVVKGTIDEDVFNTISKKQDFQIELYDSSKT